MARCESSWQDLRDRFLAAVVENPPGEWLRVWQLLIEHAWFQQQLQMAATRVLRTHQRPLGWNDDVAQDAMLVLARRLRRNPDLGIDPERAQEHFAGWMRRIVTRICVDAVRRLERQFGRSATLPEPERPDPRQRAIKLHVELDLALDELPREERVVVTLYAKGFALREIARELNLSYWQVYRRFQAAVERLRAIL